jgi:FecR protein
VVARSIFKFAGLAGALLLVAGALTPALAQDPEDLRRGVARISLMDGEVSVRRGDSGEWVAGVINAPLMTDDRIATGQNSRAEIQFDAANVLRMGGNAEVHLALLESGRLHVEIYKGTVTFRMLRASNADIELNTPSISVRPAREGAYRISVSEAAESEITPRLGDVEVFSPKGTQWVYNGQTMMAHGNPQDPEFQVVNAIPIDDWDHWNEARDHSLQSSRSDQYVPPGVSGAGDLDAAGTWENVPPYGNVWHPTAVGPGWAPYRNGRWVWVDWYGWTWVSYDPWGWAPYHYGRWFFDVRWGWNWYPGALSARAYWSPALVGFFGYGGGGGFGVGVGFGFANIGWVPLAPFETFRPWWGGGFAGGLNRGVNITNANVTALYRNARVSNGISGVAAGDFTAGRFSNVQRVSGSQVQTAGLVNGRVPLNPSVASRRFSDRAVANVPRPTANTQFFSRSAGQTGAQAGARSATASQAQSGYHRFGEPASTTGSQNTRPPQAAAGAQGQRPGSLQRFGQPSSNQSAPRNDRPSASPGGNGTWKSFGTPGSSAPARQPYSPPQQNKPATSGSGASQGTSAPRSAPAPASHPASNGGRAKSGGSKGHR